MRTLLPLLLLGPIACSNRVNVDAGDPDRDNFEDAELIPEWVEDHHAQVGVPAVDVLWVIDNSLSMYEEQRALTNNFTSFMKSFSESELELDYQIGVVSTGYDDELERGHLRTALDHRGDTVRWIDSEVKNSEDAFREMAQLGVDGPMDEKGRAQIYTALQTLGDTENFGFMRPDAYLSVIVLSDEDDFSGDVPVGVDGFVDWLQDLKVSPEQVSFSSIVATDECVGLDPSSEYLAISEAVGGVVHPICEPSWASILEQLGLAAAGLRAEFPLSQLPDPKSIVVQMKAPRQQWQDVPGGLAFVYERTRNVIVFSEAPPPNADIRIRYNAFEY